MAKDEVKVILVTADFYSEFELYETTDPDDLKEWVRDMVNGRFRDLDERYHELSATHDTMETEEAIRVADEIIYMSDLDEEGE